MWSLFIAVLFVAAVVGPFCYAGPSRCMDCDKRTWEDCDRKDDSDPCRNGESYCYSAIAKYNTTYEKDATRVIRGCMADICTDKMKACEFLREGLSRRYPQLNLTQCEVDCCTTDNCNANTRPPLPNKDGSYPTATTAANTGRGPSRCMDCYKRTWEDCDRKDDSDPCRNGESYCYSAIAKYNTTYEKDATRVIRGCMADICTDQKKACDFVKGQLSRRYPQLNLTQCEIDCCTTDDCNANTRPSLPNKAAGPRTCKFCVAEGNLEDCEKSESTQTCAAGFGSLGTTHCYTAVARISNSTKSGFARGCIDCTNKVEACAAIKASVKKLYNYDVEDCGIECCTTENCNDNTRPNKSNNDNTRPNKSNNDNTRPNKSNNDNTRPSLPNKSNYSNLSGVTAVVTLVLGLLSIF